MHSAGISLLAVPLWLSVQYLQCSPPASRAAPLESKRHNPTTSPLHPEEHLSMAQPVDVGAASTVSPEQGHKQGWQTGAGRWKQH